MNLCVPLEASGSLEVGAGTGVAMSAAKINYEALHRWSAEQDRSHVVQRGTLGLLPVWRPVDAIYLGIASLPGNKLQKEFCAYGRWHTLQLCHLSDPHFAHQQI